MTRRSEKYWYILPSQKVIELLVFLEEYQVQYPKLIHLLQKMTITPFFSVKIKEEVLEPTIILAWQNKWIKIQLTI